MARQCDGCNQLIEQKNDEFIELWVRVLDSTKDSNQDEKASFYGDFCDTCIANGTALKHALEAIDWTLEPKAVPA